ncbi:hypothetical protein FHT21_003591 [Pedobacter sp. SG908]|nr:hypothetical protein [Pedobacter sp. SG908]NMN38596.1 hypothetical protein [Pedobacter sp. SG918]
MMPDFYANVRLSGIVIPNSIGNHVVLMNVFEKRKTYE